MTFRPNFTPPPAGAGGRFRKEDKFSRFQNNSRDEHRINERIRVPRVRLIDENGGQVGIVETREALQMARSRGLDLMEVAPEAQPPVCKIVDYGKFKYEKKKKEQQAKKKQVVVKVKEIQLRPGTEEHDLQYKIKAIRTFLEEGDKAKVTMMFRGREITNVEQGSVIMKRIIEEIQDLGAVEADPKLEGKKMIMVIAPGAAPKKVVKPKEGAGPITPVSK